jgi:CDP-diacylglycerol---serine O-phosphatidyltransferase
MAGSLNHRRKRNVMIIFPSMITTFSMVFGFVSMLMAAEGKFTYACYLVMVSIIMDGLDGKVARYTNTASEFGIQYDSLADVVAFGVAPCMIYFRFYLHGQVTDQVFYLLPMMYLTCGAVRLARFNVTASIYGKSHFTGLPIPAAAFMVVSGPLLYEWAIQYPRFAEWGWTPHLSKDNFFQVSIATIIVLSLSMISTWRFDTPGTFFIHRFRKRGVAYLVLLATIATMLISFPVFAVVLSCHYLITMIGRAALHGLRRSHPPAPEETLEEVVEEDNTDEHLPVRPRSR